MGCFLRSVPSWGSRETSVSLLFLDSRILPHSLAHGLLLHPHNQQHHIFKSVSACHHISFSDFDPPALPYKWPYGYIRGFPGGSVVKNLPANAGNVGSIPGSGKSPVGGTNNPFQCSHLKNSTDRVAWQFTVHGVAKSWTQLSTHTTVLKSISFS